MCHKGPLLFERRRVIVAAAVPVGTTVFTNELIRFLTIIHAQFGHESVCTNERIITF